MNTNGRRAKSSIAIMSITNIDLFLPPHIIGRGPSKIIPLVPLILGLIENINTTSPKITKTDPKENNWNCSTTVTYL